MTEYFETFYIFEELLNSGSVKKYIQLRRPCKSLIVRRVYLKETVASNSMYRISTNLISDSNGTLTMMIDQKDAIVSESHQGTFQSGNYAFDIITTTQTTTSLTGTFLLVLEFKE